MVKCFSIRLLLTFSTSYVLSGCRNGAKQKSWWERKRQNRNSHIKKTQKTTILHLTVWIHQSLLLQREDLDPQAERLNWTLGWSPGGWESEMNSDHIQCNLVLCSCSEWLVQAGSLRTFATPELKKSTLLLYDTQSIDQRVILLDFIYYGNPNIVVSQ